MPLRLSLLRRSGFTVPSSEELESQILLNRFRSKRRTRWTLRALTASRVQAWVVAGGVLLGAALFLGPWLIDEYSEMLGYKFVPVPPTAMPRMSPTWWENEWRKGNPLWRAGESRETFYDGPFDFVRDTTGRDLHDAAAFRKSPAEKHTKALPLSSPVSDPSWRPRPWLRRLSLMCGTLPVASSISISSGSAFGSSAAAPPRVFVPLCGDSPIVREFAARGFEVDAVDASETAMRACVERTERGLAPELFSRVHLHWKDIFSPELWDGPLRDRRFDVIYERQGMTSLNREQRADYAFLLKQALAPDGVVYIEGTFRTGRVRGNALHGPPYALSRRELQELFPAREGFVVQCEETNDAITKLSRENRLLRRVPKELYVTPFHCVAYRKGLDEEDRHTS